MLRRLISLLLIGCSLSCGSVSTSATHAYALGASELRVRARSERGTTSDHLYIVVNGVEVADGPFGPEQATGTLLRGDFEGEPVEAYCRHRWRPGLHIGVRCAVRIGQGEPVELDF